MNLIRVSGFELFVCAVVVGVVVVVVIRRRRRRRRHRVQKYIIVSFSSVR